MPKLGIFSGREICAIPAAHGFQQVCIRGSHAVMQREEPEGGTRTVPVPLHKEVKAGTLLSIIR